jgi:type I restriction enzyme M protein
MTEKQIITTIEAFGFTSNPKDAKVYSKTYDKIKYQMSVDFTKKRIDFGLEIKKGDETTSHLENPENVVVLECVDRLLEKGYKPADLTLEKKWKLGRTAKSGKADITVKGKDGKTLLIIECKTWGKEYEKELDNMKSNGGQLFSYYQQDKNTRYLCLYASREHNGKIEKANALIKVEDSTEEKVNQQETEKLITYDQAKTIKEMLEVWKHKTKGKQTFLNSGLFEPEIEPYNPGYIPIKISDLKDFGKDDKGKVFNQFEEILRHNNISDRSNAFNRIISLILAKIVDENKGEEAITDFQIKEGIDDAETLLERLQSLYSKAMRDYLDEEVIDYKLEDIEAQIANFPRQTAKETLYRIYKELKFYQNNEFAFKEVYNKKLFEENAKVLEEVVRLFQKYRFKYDQKAQFLGDFFELMLESGYKQSEGQFFTPTPIARFIISSIPLKSIVKEKLKKGDKLFLPKVIDFACGSGHFLTEAIEEIADLIKAMDESEIEDEKSITELKRYKEDMRWAGEYIFGLEKDYRLARTSQVACFMHGDGDANIIFGDGLEKHPRLAKDGTFDVLIANPPYTIKDFKKHLNVNPHDFELWEHVTPDSDDIEVFFIERMKQLLRPGGMAGIILPSSILSNAGAYTKAREIILKHFEIKAIVEFGGNTFGATSTNTVTLFLKKRNEDFVTNCQYIAEDFISENKEREGDFLNSEELFENYVAQLELEMDDYKTFIGRNPNEDFKETEFYKSYKSWFDGLTEVVNLKKRKSFTDLPKADQDAKLKSMFYDLVLEIETEKFFYFLLTHRIEEDPENFGWYDDQTEDGTPLKVAYPQQKAVPQKMLIVKTGSTNKEQEKFLGYKFSNRRGYKGIDFTGDTLMFDRADQLNPKKVNSYIYKNFVDEKIKVDEELADNLSLVRLTDCINFEKIDFDKRLNLSAESFADPKDYKWPTKAFKYVLQPITGSQTKIEKTEWKETGDIPVISQEKDFISGYVSDVEPVTDLPVIVFGDHTTIFKYIDFQFVRGADGVKLFKPIVDYIPKAFYYICQTLDIPASQKYTRHYKYLSNVKIPIPDKDIQQKIITEIEAIEAKEAKAKKVIEERHFSIKSVVNELFENNSVSFKIKQYFDINRDSIDPKTEYGETEFTYVDIDSVGKGDGNISFVQKVIGNNAASRAKRVAKDDTVIVSTVRPYLKGFAYLEKEVENTVYSTGFALINTKDEKKYITKLLYYYFMYSDNLMKQIVAKMPKASYPSINKGDIEAFVIPSITITEQKKALSELDKLEKEIQKQEQTIAKTEEEKKAILTKYLEK